LFRKIYTSSLLKDIYVVSFERKYGIDSREKTTTARSTQSAGQISLLLLRNIDLMPDKVPMRVPRKPKTPSSSSRLLGKSSGYAVDICGCGRRILGSNGRIFYRVKSFSPSLHSVLPDKDERNLFQIHSFVEFYL
ncbi:hypothetical protein ALC60_01225, partial [Trachymyrmex zeteki]